VRVFPTGLCRFPRGKLTPNGGCIAMRSGATATATFSRSVPARGQEKGRWVVPHRPL